MPTRCRLDATLYGWYQVGIQHDMTLTNGREPDVTSSCGSTLSSTLHDIVGLTSSDIIYLYCKWQNQPLCYFTIEDTITIQKPLKLNLFISVALLIKKF